jgi:hypothetical protein
MRNALRAHSGIDSRSFGRKETPETSPPRRKSYPPVFHADIIQFHGPLRMSRQWLPLHAVILSVFVKMLVIL